jgi:hypothetical protein
MNLSAASDWITKGVAAIGALAGVYTFVTSNADEVTPVVLTLWGLVYEVIIGGVGLVIAAQELRYWRGPAYRRPSYQYRLGFTSSDGKVPTKLEILEGSGRRDQFLTLAFGLGCASLLLPGAYLAMSDDLREGFPISTWSITWFMGILALILTVFMLGSMAWGKLRAQHRARRKKRCGTCGEDCPEVARVCSHCSESFPAWKLLRPSTQGGSEMRQT